MFIENNNKKTFVPKVTKLKNITKSLSVRVCLLCSSREMIDLVFSHISCCVTSSWVCLCSFGHL